MKVSALVPFRSDGGWRDRLWAWNSQQWAAICPQIEVVVGVDDPGELFNAGRAINRAGDKASGDVFVTVAADFLPDPDVINEAVDLISQGSPWVALWSHTGFLTQASTEALLAGESKGWEYELHAGINNAGHALPREAWFDVGGVDERMAGWGPEDLAFRRALETLRGPGPTINATCVHLWHPRREQAHERGASGVNEAFYRDNYAANSGNYAGMRAVVEAAKAAR